MRMKRIMAGGRQARRGWRWRSFDRVLDGHTTGEQGLLYVVCIAINPSYTSHTPTLARPTSAAAHRLYLRASCPRICHAPASHVDALGPAYEGHPLAPAPAPPMATLRARDFGWLPIPARLRFDAARPPAFGWTLNITFALASTLRASQTLSAQMGLMGRRSDHELVLLSAAP
jgi:hypothetical protein